MLWEKITGEILDRTVKFPKHARFTFSFRIDNLTLDILERLFEAKYVRVGNKGALLREVDLSLARLRVLLRVSHDRRYLSTRALEHLARRIDEAGRMVGGWTKQQGEATP